MSTDELQGRSEQVDGGFDSWSQINSEESKEYVLGFRVWIIDPFAVPRESCIKANERRKN